MQIFYKAFSTIIYEITAAVISLIGYLISFVAWLADYFIKLNLAVTEDRIVTLGWTITRDLANLGFVLVIIIIAIATILRIQKYGAQQLLLKLVAAAIIVNFSLTIAGFILNFSNVLTNFFLANAFPEGAKLGTGLAGAFNPQQYYPDKIAAGEILTVLISPLFSVIFILVLLMVMIIFLVAIIYRYVLLAFLLILAPLAWLFWIFPALSGYFQKWWHKFFQWTFFLPAMAFFIYLPIKAIELAPSAFSPSEDVGVLTQLMRSAGQMIILIGLLIGGLMIANQTGIAGAAGAMTLAKKTGKLASKLPGKAGGALGRRVLSAGKRTDEKTGEVTSGAQRAATAMTKIPVLGRAFRGMATGIGKTVKGVDEEKYKKSQQKISNITNADALNRAQTATNMTNNGEGAVLFERVAKDNNLDKLDQKQFQLLSSKTQMAGKMDDNLTKKTINGLTQKSKTATTDEERNSLQQKIQVSVQMADRTKSPALAEIIKTQPHLAEYTAGKPGQSGAEKIADAVRKLTTDDATKIDPAALRAKEVVHNLSENLLKRIAERGSENQKEAVVEMFDELDDEMKKYLRQNVGFGQAMKKAGKNTAPKTTSEEIGEKVKEAFKERGF